VYRIRGFIKRDESELGQTGLCSIRTVLEDTSVDTHLLL